MNNKWLAQCGWRAEWWKKQLGLLLFFLSFREITEHLAFALPEDKNSWNNNKRGKREKHGMKNELHLTHPMNVRVEEEGLQCNNLCCLFFIMLLNFYKLYLLYFYCLFRFFCPYRFPSSADKLNLCAVCLYQKNGEKFSSCDAYTIYSEQFQEWMKNKLQNSFSGVRKKINSVALYCTTYLEEVSEWKLLWFVRKLCHV